MKNHWLHEIHVRMALFLALLLSLGLLADSISAAPRPTATVIGRAIVKRKNLATTTTLQANDKLYAGDVVATGGAEGATIQFTDGSRVDMAGRSVIEITSPVAVGNGRTLFRALGGRMAAHLRPGKVVATRTALVRVKGTVILISVEEDGTATLSVLEGAAEFFNPCGSVIVPAGSQSVTQPGNAPTTPTAIPDIQALLRNWEDRTDVLAPFVTPNTQNTGVQTPGIQPTANVIGSGRLSSPVIRLPDYLQEASDKLNAIPLKEREIFISSLAKMQPKSQESQAGAANPGSNRDCGCGGANGPK